MIYISQNQSFNKRKIQLSSLFWTSILAKVILGNLPCHWGLRTVYIEISLPTLSLAASEQGITFFLSQTSWEGFLVYRSASPTRNAQGQAHWTKVELLAMVDLVLKHEAL